MLYSVQYQPYSEYDITVYMVFVNMPIDKLAVIPAVISQVIQDAVFMY